MKRPAENDSAESAQEPLRSVHTSTFVELLTALRSSLVVST